VTDLCLNNNRSKNIPNSQNNGPNKEFPNRNHPSRNGINNDPNEQLSDTDNSDKDINRENGNKFSSPPGYLTKSRYITVISEQTIHENWPKLSQRATPIIEKMINQPLDFDNGKGIDRLIKQNSLEQYASATRNAIEKSDKDYDKMSYMMDSIVFDKMTMIGSREALIRPWDPSLLNRASSKGSYPYPSVNIYRFNKISFLI
jgi:hypothetical protein